MALVQPIFDTIRSATGSAQQEAWADLGVIPAGKQWLLGPLNTFIAQDKDLQFELRVNKATKSAGTVADTEFLDGFAAQAPNGVDRDLYWFGAIATLAPLVVSTGVEHLWLRVTSKSNTAGAYTWVIRYLEQAAS